MYTDIAAILRQAAEDKGVSVAVLTGRNLSQIQMLCGRMETLRQSASFAMATNLAIQHCKWSAEEKEEIVLIWCT